MNQLCPILRALLRSLGYAGRGSVVPEGKPVVIPEPPLVATDQTHLIPEAPAAETHGHSVIEHAEHKLEELDWRLAAKVALMQAERDVSVARHTRGSD